MVTYVELEKQPHKPAGASHTGHNCWFSFLLWGLPFSCSLHLRSMQRAGAGFLLCSDSAVCIGAQWLLEGAGLLKSLSLGLPKRDNLEAAQIHSRLILRDNLGSGARQNAPSLRLIYNTNHCLRNNGEVQADDVQENRFGCRTWPKRTIYLHKDMVLSQYVHLNLHGDFHVSIIFCPKVTLTG